ncbi:MAG: hypothetical protein SFV19_13940 [Rhodospirillaceae bacterium]|nr:hypothetical protein [Rhodospirillaceae bacterium]
MVMAMSSFIQFLGTTTASVFILAALGWILRAWFVERLRSSIKAEYDKELATHKNELERALNAEIELLKNELRTKESEFTSNLRVREAEIAALREGVFSGRFNRQALLDKRKLEAVDKIWGAVAKLTPLKRLSAQIAWIKIDVAVDEAAKNPKLRAFFEVINKSVDHKAFDHLTMIERPFLTSLAWSYFSAYEAIVASAFLLSKTMELGLDDGRKLLDEIGIRNILAAALPHRREQIAKINVGSFHFLLVELEGLLLTELQKILEGVEADKASIEQSILIESAIKVASDESEKARAQKAQKEESPKSADRLGD